MLKGPKVEEEEEEEDRHNLLLRLRLRFLVSFKGALSDFQKSFELGLVFKGVQHLEVFFILARTQIRSSHNKVLQGQTV
jgi:hypothetical protein